MAVPANAIAGRISKQYGLRGSVHVILDPVAKKEIKEGIPLFIQIDGQRVPYFVEELTMLSGDQAIIKFEFIDDVEKARAVSGADLYLDTETDVRTGETGGGLRTLSGYRAYDRSIGYLGRVRDLMEHDLNPVLLIDHHGRELMVPAIPEFILNIDHRKKSILFDLPEGLTAL
jgi:16S rRNA processing protein RimM